jgi:hypothetical protein
MIKSRSNEHTRTKLNEMKIMFCLSTLLSHQGSCYEGLTIGCETTRSIGETEIAGLLGTSCSRVDTVILSL